MGWRRTGNRDASKLVLSAAYVFVFCWILNSNFVSCEPLYNENDPILQLNASDFFPAVLGQKTAHIIEFYNSWCGHCIRYAPVWKAFAQDIQTWHNVVVVVAIDCADEENFPKCTHYRVPLFPTIKFLWTNLTKDDLGEITSHDMDINIVRHNFLDFLEKKMNQGSKDFPFLKPRNEQTVDELWAKTAKNIEEIFLIVENNGSYIGKEVILDASSIKNVIVLRAFYQNSHLMKNLRSINLSSQLGNPTLLLLKRNRGFKTIALASSVELAREEFGTNIFTLTGKKPMFEYYFNRNNHHKNSEAEVISVVGVNPEIDHFSTTSFKDERIHMVDLHNAIHYLLMQEVRMKAVLVEDDLASLKAFLAALTKTFPGSQSVTNYLRHLYQWVSSNSVSLQTSDLYDYMRIIQKNDNAYLPPMKEWVHCKGSKSLYRGYPCGLWTLFHTMTVQAYNAYLTGELVNPQQVLVSIKGYILHFFSCGDCVKHFESMSMGMEEGLRHPNDTVLWLWQAHNKVNKRLAGDSTEDPKNPKIQFPSKIHCPECHLRAKTSSESSDPVWNVTAVLSFLRKYYSDIKVDLLIALDRHPRLLASGEKIENTAIYFSSHFKIFNNADISLCLILYVSSALLLIAGYFVILIRRRKGTKYRILV